MALEDENLALPVNLNPEGEETEEDLSRPALARVGEMALSGTDWTTETILRQLERGNIDLNPRFQRREAWRAQAKSRFIESLFLGLPVPQIVLAESRSNRGSYIVIDGKQRLLSLRQFASQPDDERYPVLRLTDLQVKTELNGMTLGQLSEDPRFVNDVRFFHNQTIRTVVMKAWPNEEVLYLVFLRLNTGSVRLSPQELRQALHPGKFVEFVDSKSGEIAGLRRIFKTPKPDFRMRDAELLVRFIAFKHFLADYRGNLKDFLDTTCERLNDQWGQLERQLEAEADELERALEATYEVFGKNAFAKWNGLSYETSFNRALFDVMAYYFSEPRILNKLRSSKNRKAIEKGFKGLCVANPEFVKSIESTTKSIPATRVRLQAWGSVLQRILGIRIALPKVGPNEGNG